MYGEKHYLLKLLMSDAEVENDLACKIMINDTEIEKLRSIVLLAPIDPYIGTNLMHAARKILNSCKNKKCIEGTNSECRQHIKLFKQNLNKSDTKSKLMEFIQAL